MLSSSWNYRDNATNPAGLEQIALFP